jgi:hypothetical protein
MHINGTGNLSVHISTNNLNELTRLSSVNPAWPAHTVLTRSVHPHASICQPETVLMVLRNCYSLIFLNTLFVDNVMDCLDMSIVRLFILS